MLDQVITSLSGRNARAADNQRDMSSLVIQKLLAPCVADAMVGEEHYQSVVQHAFVFQSFDHLTDVTVRQSHAVQIRSPVF